MKIKTIILQTLIELQGFCTEETAEKLSNHLIDKIVEMIGEEYKTMPHFLDSTSKYSSDNRETARIMRDIHNSALSLIQSKLKQI